MVATKSWWNPDRYRDRRPALLSRNRIMRAFRDWFDSRDFIEADPCVMQLSPGNETHLHAFATEAVGMDGARHPLYLNTSPEFACKKLLAAGEERLFTFAHAFRNRETSPLHHPEFTMLEWYRADEAYDVLMEDCAALLALAADAAATRTLRWRDRRCDPLAQPERLTVAEACQRHGGIDLMATIAADGATDRDGLAAQMVAAGLRVSPEDSWSDLLSGLLVTRIEPHLGINRPTILCDYPISEAALARPKPDDGRVAERFELYVCGVELANAFGELTDPDEQRRRFEADMAAKHRLYGERYPIDDDFLAAVAAMPPASGIAMGFDRLVMLATGASRITDVLWAPVPEVGGSTGLG
ncbi:MAG: EF-P lysine aminoacylase EpmA [Beijerinckiaceae bacterium]